MKAERALLALWVLFALFSLKFFVGADECDPNHCIPPSCILETDGTCRCGVGYSGQNCSVKPCENNDCANNEFCKENSYIVDKGYLCIPNVCENLNCSVNQTCGRSSNQYICVDDPCQIPDKCNQTNGRCIYYPKHGNHSCQCKVGYDPLYSCNKPLPCSNNTATGGVCQNGGICMAMGQNNFQGCQCVKGYKGLRCEQHICDADTCINGNCSASTDEPYYTCDCDSGYTGINCNEEVDPCDPNPCKNNGTCMLVDSEHQCNCTDDWDPETNCTSLVDHCKSDPCQNDGNCSSDSSGFTCTCTEGYYGEMCSFNNPCKCGDKGTCVNDTGSLTCNCQPGYKGPRCQMVDHCHNSSCNLRNSRCVSSDVSFTCECFPGYVGRNCSEDLCICANNGNCSRSRDSFSCDCPTGYTGDKCQHELCSLDSCYNSGDCSNDVNMSFTCDCPQWASGLRCEGLADVSTLGVIIPNATVCSPTCNQTRSNGQCDPNCDVSVCQFDGGDCGNRTCDKRTSSDLLCHDVFKNGVCNPECNVPECLYDGLDCRQDQPVCPNEKCVSLYGNDECNEECNTAACVYDGGDCAAREELPDILFIVLATNLDDFDARENSFLLSIGEILNCIPVLLGRTQSGGSPRAKRDETNSTSVSVDLKLDVSQCNSSVEGCVGSVEEASEILDRVSERGYRPAGFTIEETGTKNDPTDSTTPDSPFPLGAIGGIVVAILLFSVGFVVLGILLKRKRTMKAAIWRPEGPNTTPRSDSFDEDSPTAKRIVPGKERSSKDLHSESDGYPMKPVCEKGEWVDVPGEMETTVNGLPSAQFVVGQLQRDPPSWNALHYRALRQPSLVQEFVTRFNEETDNSTDVNIRGPGGYTTLMVAVMLGNVQREGEEESECDLTRPSLFNGSEAASPPRSLTVKDLLKMGADPNLKNELGQTALHIAASCSRADVTRLLLSYRADPNAQDCNGRSPLHVAIVSEADGVFQILLRNKNTNPDLDAEDGTTPLILATQHHAVSMVEQLLKEAHVDANTQDKSGKTALHWAASMNMMEIMKILLKQGANKDSQDNNGQTPLFLAAKEGSSDAVRLLMESLANRNIQDNMERTPLRIAESRFHKDIVHLLTDSYFSHIGETASQQPEVRIHGPVCHGLSRPDTYDYLPEATSVPPPPYQTQNYRTPYSSAAVYDSHLTTTTTHCSYRPCEPDGAEDILPSINGSPHSVGSGGVCTSNGMPTACSLEPCVPASIYDSTNTTTASQYPVDTRQPTELHDTLLQPMVSPMSGYSPPYTGDLIPQDLQHGSSLGVGTTSPEVFSNPNIDLNVHFYPSPPESNKSPCSYDNGMQIPTPPESDGQIESPPMASCVRLGPTIGFPANQGVYHGQQHPPLQQY